MRTGPFEYRPKLIQVSLQEHRQRLLRTPFRVISNTTSPTTQPTTALQSFKGVSSSDAPTIEEEESETSTIPNPVRNFDCTNYERCLNLTAALNWQSFTCKGCNGIINQHLLNKAAKIIEQDRSLELLTGNLKK